MTEMIERVARALCVQDGRDPDAQGWKNTAIWQAYTGEAKAAIEAMGEPTQEMTAVVVDVGKTRAKLCAIYSSMIQAALEEPQQ